MGLEYIDPFWPYKRLVWCDVRQICGANPLAEIQTSSMLKEGLRKLSCSILGPQRFEFQVQCCSSEQINRCRFESIHATSAT